MNAEISPHAGSVLLSFRAENVRSFRDELELSLLATSLAEPDVPRSLPWREDGEPIRVLPAACVLGANASGKSNVLRAMADMRLLVLDSFRSGNPGGGMPRKPFLLDPVSAAKPSRFAIDVVLSGVRHRYGFTFDDERVLDEWAFSYPRGRARLLFHRHAQPEVALGAGDRAKGRAVAELLRPNALYLSTAAAVGHPALTPLYQWFQRNLLLAEAGSRSRRWAFTAELLRDPDRRDQVLAFIRAADLGVTDAQLRKLDPQMLERMRRAVRVLAGTEGESDDDEIEPSAFLQPGVTLSHRGVAGDVEFDVADESLGTLVWLGLAGPIVEAIAHGSVLLADELEASLHPNLVAHLVGLFQAPTTNPRRGQLIFNSHEASLLGNSVSDRTVGRDQVWFSEKLPDGATRLYPLSDLNPRKEEAVGRRYLAGRYGATPIIASEEFAEIADLISAGVDK
ncbi:MAG: AAA family ATPase [Acidimicrobiales bacterium]